MKHLHIALFTILSLSSHIQCMDTKKPLHLAILVSGSGTNMAAILDKKIDGVHPCVVISNREAAHAIQKAKDRGVPTVYIDSRKKSNPEPGQYTKKLIACLTKHNVTPENGLICLAGFMRILDAEFVNHYRGRIINLHPSLLPSFKGIHAIGKAVEYGAKVAGCTVHFVDEGLDTGPIIKQATVPIDEDDTEETLHAKIQQEEHRIFPEAVKLFAQNRLVVEGRRVKILPPTE